MVQAAAVLRPRIRGGAGLNILAKRNQHVLGSFADSNVLLAFDYDGTLAPIAQTPDKARMTERTRRLLAQAAARYPCVVISGRTLADLSQRLSGIPVWYVFGNHGFEPFEGNEQHAARVREWVRRLRRLLPRDDGVVIEEKTFSVTVHYRHVRKGDKPQVLTQIEHAVRQLPEVRAVAGSEAINLLPTGGPHKGVALQEARRLFACDTAIYVGDDGTDEDAFRSGRPDQLLGIRIGSNGPSQASYRLSSQREINALLEALVALRPRSRS